MKKFLTAILVALMVAVSIPAAVLAVDSPTLGDQPILTAVPSNPNAGTVTKTEVKDDTYRIVATPSPGYTFSHWTVEADGTYTIVEGDLNSAEILVQYDANTHFIAHFNPTGSGQTPGGQTPGSTSTTAPSTGDHSILIVLAATAALIGAAYACKKIWA